MPDQIRMTPEQYADKQAQRLKGSLDEVRRGINAVQESPMEKAAQNQDKWIMGVQKAADNGKWRQGLLGVTLQAWKDKAANVGVARIPAGIDAAKPKVTSFARELFAHENEGLRQLESMPNVTLEDSIQRMTYWTRHMAGMRRG